MKRMHVHVHGSVTQDDWTKWNSEHPGKGGGYKPMSHADLQHHAYKATGKQHSRSEAEAWHTALPHHAKERLQSQHEKMHAKMDTRNRESARKIREYQTEHAKKTGYPITPQLAARRVQGLDDEGGGIRRDQIGRFSTSSGTGEQHSATAELHTSLAARKGTDHPHHAMHVAAAEAHSQAASFLGQANKSQHPGAAVEAERHAKIARQHENTINKGRGSTPGGEVKAQNKAMSDPRVMKENAARKAEFDTKHDKGSKVKKKTTDQEALRAYVSDDWTKWNAEHGSRTHSGENSAHADIVKRRESLASHGFKHTYNFAHETQGMKHHYAHPEGHTAVVHHVRDPETNRVTVRSKWNNKRSDGAFGHEDSPETKASMAKFNKKHPKTADQSALAQYLDESSVLFVDMTVDSAAAAIALVDKNLDYMQKITPGCECAPGSGLIEYEYGKGEQASPEKKKKKVQQALAAYAAE